MTGGTKDSHDDAGKLGELAYLCSSVSHHVINAFSSIVSNAELIRANPLALPSLPSLSNPAARLSRQHLMPQKLRAN